MVLSWRVRSSENSCSALDLLRKGQHHAYAAKGRNRNEHSSELLCKSHWSRTTSPIMPAAPPHYATLPSPPDSHTVS